MSSSDPWVMVVGGLNDFNSQVNAVELVSLDPINHPVPDCLRNLGRYPVPVEGAAGATLHHGEPIRE